MRPPVVTDAVLADVERHVRSDLDREVGGVFVGTIEDGSAHITAAIPALRAEAGSMNVTFTHEVWEDVLATVDREHPGNRIVGWYHSHPDFGVFMSDYDIFIHKNFFPEPAMVALVVDQIRGRAGWFAGSEEIRQIGSYELVPSGIAIDSGTAAMTARSATPRGGTSVLIAAAAAVSAFALGWLLAPDSGGRVDQEVATADDAASSASLEERAQAAERRAREAEAAAAALEQDLEAALEAGAMTADGVDAIYTVAPGDSLWSIAQRFFGDGSRWPEILASNPGLTEAVEPGDQLRLPGLLAEPGPGSLSLEVSGE